MKVLKKRFGLLRFFTILFIALSFISALLTPHVIVNSGYLNWLFLVACLLFFFIPVKTPVIEKKETLRRAFLLVSLFQWSSLAIFYGFTQLCGKWLTLYTPAQTNLFAQSTNLLWIHFGLMPWPIVALCTVFFSRYIKKEDTYPHLLLQPLLLSKADNTSGLLLNTLTRGCFTLLLSSLIAFGALSIAYLIAPQTLHQFLGFEPVILILLVALFAFFASKKAQHYWRIIATTSLLKPYIILTGIMTTLGFALFIGLGINAALLSTQPKTLHIIHFLLRTGWKNYWDMMIICFWLLWTIPVSLWFTHILKTPRRQKIIAFTLFWPIVWTILLLCSEHWGIFLTLNTTGQVIILLAGTLTLFVLISSPQSWQTTLRGYAQMSLEKNRPATRLLRNLAMISTLLLYLYWQSGIIGITLMFIFIAMPVGLLLLLALINIIAY